MRTLEVDVSYYLILAPVIIVLIIIVLFVSVTSFVWLSYDFYDDTHNELLFVFLMKYLYMHRQN